MKTCTRCGLGIIWEGMMTDDGACHPDCKKKGDHGAPAKNHPNPVNPLDMAAEEAHKSARSLRGGRSRRNGGKSKR